MASMDVVSLLNITKQLDAKTVCIYCPFSADELESLLAQDFIQAFCECSDQCHRQGQPHVEQPLYGLTCNLHNVNS